MDINPNSTPVLEELVGRRRHLRNPYVQFPPPPAPHHRTAPHTAHRRQTTVGAVCDTISLVIIGLLPEYRLRKDNPANKSGQSTAIRQNQTHPTPSRQRSPHHPTPAGKSMTLFVKLPGGRTATHKCCSNDKTDPFAGCRHGSTMIEKGYTFEHYNIEDGSRIVQPITVFLKRLDGRTTSHRCFPGDTVNQLAGCRYGSKTLKPGSTFRDNGVDHNSTLFEPEVIAGGAKSTRGQKEGEGPPHKKARTEDPGPSIAGAAAAAATEKRPGQSRAKTARASVHPVPLAAHRTHPPSALSRRTAPRSPAPEEEGQARRNGQILQAHHGTVEGQDLVRRTRSLGKHGRIHRGRDAHEP